MKKILDNYIALINDFESLMREKYSIEKDISLWSASSLSYNIFDKKGTINEYTYFYHGAGCRVEKKGIICEYDTAPLNGYDIKFTADKFLEFIESHPSYKEVILDRCQVSKELNDLVNEGVLSLYDFSKDFDIQTYPMAKYLEVFQHKI